MATLEGIIRDGRGSAGSRGAWKVYAACDSDPYCGAEYELWHHGTLMLKWRRSTRYRVEVLQANIGRGSVSDQQGMNKAFRELGVGMRYVRKGGAYIDWG